MNARKLGIFVATIAIAGVSAMALADHHEGVLDANTATAEQMAALPHMDNVLAAAVAKNRPFLSISDLHELLSADLGEDELTELYARLFVPISLNDAAEADIMLIPGMSKRMAHEFEEYRPYTSMEQFRREIGKYVDEAEVSRLEQYVTLD
jgi:DNA uptake protein ComE-like DNA-binding protein